MLSRTLSLLAIAALLPACAATQMTPAEQELAETMAAESFQPATRELRASIETQPLLAQATFWSREYQLNPADLEATIKLAAAVRKMGNPGRAAEITQTTRALYPKDPYLAAEYAAALVTAENGKAALPVLDEAIGHSPGYARLWSLRGAALDQAGQYQQARQSYGRALQITPHDPNVLANMGLSFALEGDSQTAEKWLVRAAAIPGASDTVTRNLELVQRMNGTAATPPVRSAERVATSAPAPVPSQPAMRAPAAPTAQGLAPRGNFQVFDPSQARSAAEAARAVATQRAASPALKATDPNALDRLARNASPAARAVSQGRSIHSAPVQGMMAPQGLAAPQGMAAPQGTPAPQTGSPFAQAPQPRPGYPQAYPQPVNPYAQSGYAQPVPAQPARVPPRGPARMRR